ncbi:MAG: hypothetical protein IPO91_28435 [Chloroflexi bacterium]|nr:hypothetical protein [Chloroflexota bacterium]
MRVDARSIQVTETRRVQLLLVGLGAAFLILAGLKPLGLPYIPGARFSDAATSHWGAALFLQRSVVRDGEFPYWRETILGGQPFAANPLNKTAYPLQWLALILPPALHINVMIVLHLLIAGAGMWTLTRSLGLSVWSAAVSVIAYVLSPRMVGHLGAGHVDIVYALAWLPWVLWAVKLAAVGSRRGLWATGLFAGLMFLADVRLSLFGLVLAGAWAIYHVLKADPTPIPSPNSGRGASGSLALPSFSVAASTDAGSPKYGRALRRGARLVGYFLPVILFLLIASAVIIPLWLWSPYLTRASLTAADASVFALRPEYLLGVFIPQTHRNVEVLTYLGLVPLILAVLGAVTARRRVLFWLVAALIAGLYALGSNGFLWNILTQTVPFLLWFRVPSRAWLIVMLVVALLAGYGAERLKRRPLQIGVLVVIAVELMFTGRAWLEWRGDDYWLPADQRELAETLIADGVDRVYSPTYSLEQQVAEQYEIDLFYGVDPFQLRDYVGAIQDVGRITFEGYSIVQPPLIGAIGEDFSTANRSAQPDTIAMWYHGVSHVLASYPIENPRLELVDDLNGVYLYANGDYSSGVRLPTDGYWRDDDARPFHSVTLLVTVGAFLTVILGTFLTLRAKT